MPLWLLLIIASLATYRLTRLVVKDDFPPVLWLRDRLAGGWRPMTSQELSRGIPSDPDHQDIEGVASVWARRWPWVPQWLADLVSCSWCASGWVSLAVILAVAFTVGVPAPVLVWPAVWAAGALIAAQRWA
jgi:hypothetical protein